MLNLICYNILEGGGLKHGAIKQELHDWMISLHDVDLVGFTEANGWDAE